MGDGLVANVVKQLHEIGLVGLLVAILIGGYRQWWVYGWHHRHVIERFEKDLEEVRADRDNWKSLVTSARVRDRRVPPAEVITPT